MKKTILAGMILTGAFVMGSVGVTSGCRKGPAERAGSKIDEATDKLKDAVDPPGPGEKAGRKVDRALGND